MMEQLTQPILIRGGLAADDRGMVRFVNDFDFAGVKRMYVLENWMPGFVRAWHGHLREAKWVTVTHGAAKVGVARITQPIVDYCPLMDVQMFILSENSPQVLCIPPGYANGSMALTEGAQVIHFSSMTLSETAGDDLRWSWDILPGVWETPQR